MATDVTGDMGDVQPFLEGPITKEKIEKIKTVPSNVVPEELKNNSWDVSEQKNGKIMAWYKDDDNNGLYEVYIGQEGGVKANPDSTYLFSNLTGLKEIDLSYFDTSNTTVMKGLFYNCEKLSTLDVGGFNTSNVTNMEALFYYCVNLVSVDLSKWDTRKVANMRIMFTNCKNLTELNLSSFNTTQVTNMSEMFINCTNLKTIYVNKDKWIKPSNTDKMFLGSTANVLDYETKEAIVW